MPSSLRRSAFPSVIPDMIGDPVSLSLVFVDAPSYGAPIGGIPGRNLECLPPHTYEGYQLQGSLLPIPTIRYPRTHHLHRLVVYAIVRLSASSKRPLCRVACSIQEPRIASVGSSHVRRCCIQKGKYAGPPRCFGEADKARPYADRALVHHL